MLNCRLQAASADVNSTGQWLKDDAYSVYGVDAATGDTVSCTGSCVDVYAEGLGTATFTHDCQPRDSYYRW
ncbi:MAG: hypothetical protein NTX21_01920 [Alphaproteobacteria bacterium]|nr:hypothetical protein [Alphaproteobacteria bacterium]